MSGNFATGYRVPFQRRGSIIGDADAAVLVDVLRSGAPLSSGQWRSDFEQAFADRVGSRYALSTTSGTVALELAIRLLDLRPGDEVIATPQTFQATIQPLLEYDARVRFCDVDPATLNLDPNLLPGLIGPRTRAILLVHYAGYPADMDAILRIARAHDLVVIEDCAHALGSSYRGRKPGALADIGCFSFHSTKNITTLGEGGMITVQRGDWADRIERMRSNEADGVYATAPEPVEGLPGVLPWMKFSDQVYRHTMLELRSAGTNATMSEAAAAVGLTQLAALSGFTERRRWIAGRLDEVLSRFPDVRLHTPAEHSEHAYHLYTAFLTSGAAVRERFIRNLDRLGVEVQLRYFPLHLIPEWRGRGHRPGECPVAERLWFEQQINLPCHPGLSDEQVDYLLTSVQAALAGATGLLAAGP